VTRPVVVVGDVMTDVVATTDQELRPGTDTPGRVVTGGGGSAANSAAWLAGEGVTTKFVGVVGDDELGSYAIRLLSAAGVEVRVRVDDTEPTGTCVVLVGPDGERTMVPDAGANLTLAEADLAAVPLAGAHLHLSGYPLLRPPTREVALALLRRARDAGASTSVDAASAGPIADCGPVTVVGWLAGVDVLLCNADEAAVLAGAPSDDDPARTASVLATLTGALVVIKLGADGALACDAAGDAVRVPALPVEVVDTTGAGDAFAAGYLTGYLAGESTEQALRRGTQVAGRAVAQLGARPLDPEAAGRTA
jgi:sugar/nucleoside kinase (ribokinase family)